MTFNTELANKVIEHIEHLEQWHKEHPGNRVVEWNQGAWRTVNECGTGMCFAGMAVQVSDKAHYLFDDEAVLALGGSRVGGVYAASEAVVLDVPKKREKQLIFKTVLDPIEAMVDPLVLKAGKAYMEGTDPDWKMPKWGASVSAAANELLGLESENDWLNMFDEGQTLEMLRAVIAVYTEHGSTKSYDALWTYVLTLHPDSKLDRKLEWESQFYHVTSDGYHTAMQVYARYEQDYAASLTKEKESIR